MRGLLGHPLPRDESHSCLAAAGSRVRRTTRGCWPPLSTTCAVPGYFAPVTIAGVDYIDGGAHSATNADLLLSLHDGLDLAIVISPLSCLQSAPRSLHGALRRLCKRSVRRATQLPNDAGIETIVVEPGADSIGAMGVDLMSNEILLDVVREAFLETGHQIAVNERRDGSCPRAWRALHDQNR